VVHELLLAQLRIFPAFLEVDFFDQLTKKMIGGGIFNTLSFVVGQSFGKQIGKGDEK